MIIPTNGRIVWYHRGTNDGIAQHDPKQPLAATIVHVWQNDRVNLVVYDSEGGAHARLSISLLQDDDKPPENGRPWCEWMPYQKGQAAKTEQLEKQVTGDAKT